MRYLSIFTCLAISQAICAAPILLKLERSGTGAATFAKNGETFEIKGALAVLATPVMPPSANHKVIELEYFCLGGINDVVLTPGPAFDQAHSQKLPPISHSEGWTSYSARIHPDGDSLPDGCTQLRIELALKADQSIQIRDVKLRTENPGEFDPPIVNPKASAPQEALETYLYGDFPGSVSEVSIGKDYVHIEGNVGREAGSYAVADIPMDMLLDDPRSWEVMVDLTPAADGSFKLDIPRFRRRGGLDYDRLTSRWQIILKGNDGYVKVSHARYGDKVETRGADLPPAKPRSKKGLGGWHTGFLPDELGELGISAVTVNVMLNSYVSLDPTPGTVPTVWQGRTYHMREEGLADLDKQFREAAKHQVMVSAIILVENPVKTEDPVVKIMGHPDATEDGIFSMPNVTSSEGIGIYGAVLNFLAERYSRLDGKYGRVHHWIMQNEVDAGWVWTNAGDKPAIVFMDLYHRSMRLMDLIARQYDPRSRPFISLTHHWGHHGAEHWYGSKLMTDLLVKFCGAEGDFPWGMAFHPYPDNLMNPRAWEDVNATFDFNTNKITPKNLEVLDAYMKTPGLLFRGSIRPVHLSENGFNSPDYSEKSFEDQAAGMAMAYKKMEKLTSIESWQYHNWVDNRREGGLKIGLRKFPDEAGDPLGKKPIWYLYQALGTPREDEIARPYLKTLGILSWDEVLHKGEIK